MPALRKACISTFALLAFTAGISSSSAHAQRASSPEASDDIRIRTYEVGDLVVNVPDYPANRESTTTISVGGGVGFGGGGGGFGGGGANSGPRGGRAEQRSFDAGVITLNSLMEAILTVVEPSSWAVNENSAPGTIQPVGSALVIRQREKVHEEISNLLTVLREGSGARRSVTIDARWLFLNSDELDRLFSHGNRDEAVVGEVALNEFTRRPTSLRGITTCFSGQLVYIVSGTRRNIVSTYIPVVGSIDVPSSDILMTALGAEAPIHYLQEGGNLFGGSRSVGYQPVIERPNFGVQFEIRPTLVHNTDAAVVDLTSTITFPGQPSPIDEAAQRPLNAGGAPAPSVDRLAIETQELATTLRVPLGKPILVGGMSYVTPRVIAESTDDVEEAALETPQLYLIVEVR